MLFDELLKFFILPATMKELAEDALMITMNPQDAADILQDVSVMLLLKADEIGDIIKPLPYLRTCVRNAARNWVKKEARKVSTDPHSMDIVTPWSINDVEIKRIEIVDWIKRSLTNYSADRQEAFIKYHLDGYTLEMLEIEYNVSKNTLSQQFLRMRTKLRMNDSALFVTLMFIMISSMGAKP